MPELSLKIGYVVFAIAFSLGLFGIFYWKCYFRKIISFSIFSSSSILLFITIAYKSDSIASFYSQENSNAVFTDPIPSVLMLTAIVVGVSIQAIALALYISFSKKPKTHD